MRKILIFVSIYAASAPSQLASKMSHPLRMYVVSCLVQDPNCLLSVRKCNVGPDPVEAEGLASCLCVSLHDLKDRAVLLRGAAGKLKRIRD